MTATATAPTRATPKRLPGLDRWLPLWIGLAMIAGLLLGRLVPAVSDVLSHLEVGGISVPIGLGLLVMIPQPTRTAMGPGPNRRPHTRAPLLRWSSWLSPPRREAPAAASRPPAPPSTTRRLTRSACPRPTARGRCDGVSCSPGGRAATAATAAGTPARCMVQIMLDV